MRLREIGIQARGQAIEIAMTQAPPHPTAANKRGFLYCAFGKASLRAVAFFEYARRDDDLIKLCLITMCFGEETAIQRTMIKRAKAEITMVNQAVI